VTVNQNAFAQGANRRRLSSGGVGVNWAGARDTSVRLVVAQRLGTSAATSDTDRAFRGWLQLVKRF
jgi:hypothetical protein